MFKKYISIALMALIISSAPFSVMAEVKQEIQNKDAAVSAIPFKTLTLDMARKMARENADSTEVYKELVKKYERIVDLQKQKLGEKYIEIDNQGVETEKYRNGQPDYDYKADIEKYEDQIKLFKDTNESDAITKYFALIDKDMQWKKNASNISLMEIDINIAKISLENGISLKADYEDAKLKKQSLLDEKDILRKDTALLFEQMNSIIGLEKTSRYTVDTFSLVSKVQTQDYQLYVPSFAIEFATKESEAIKDMTENIDEKKKQLENYSKIAPKGTEAYEVKKEELDIESLKDEVVKKEDSLFFGLEADYLDIVISLADISLAQEDMQFQSYVDSINNVYYKNGMISKRELIKRNLDNMELEQSYFSSLVDSYRKLLAYEKMNGLEKKDIEKREEKTLQIKKL